MEVDCDAAQFCGGSREYEAGGLVHNLATAAPCHMHKKDRNRSRWPDDARRQSALLEPGIGVQESKFNGRFLIPILLQRIDGIENQNTHHYFIEFEGQLITNNEFKKVVSFLP